MHYLYIYYIQYSVTSDDAMLHYIGAKGGGGYGFSDVKWENDVDDLNYDVTVGNVKHASQTF